MSLPSPKDESLQNLLIRHEGLKLKAYTDTVGKLTIGVGHNLTDRGISRAAAFFILEEDLSAVIEELDRAFPWFEDLDPVRQYVLINMGFNLGITKLKAFKNTLAAVAAGEYAKAATLMLQSKWAKQVGKRAYELASMMRSGE